MRVGSLFSGIGGLDLGLERAGVGSPVWVCEKDPAARRVLSLRWPGRPVYEDVCAIRKEDVEAPDVLCGGFP